jgi:hypothetical protein
LIGKLEKVESARGYVMLFTKIIDSWKFRQKGDFLI